MDAIFEGESPRARLALLLHHFSKLEDNREPWRIVYPLREVLLLVTCATIASCDDFDDIVAWGKHHLHFLRQFSEFHHGIPCERWLRSLINRVDPALFGRCFKSWVMSLWPGRHDLIAIDGKTARRTHDRRKNLKALHTLSAYATTARLVLAQTCVPEKTNEITAIPDLLDELAESGQLEGALVTIDAMGCQVEIADKIVAHKADYLLALKGNQPTLETDVEDYFRTAPASKLVTKTTVEKGHGRIETRVYTASAEVDWITSERSYPGAPRFTSIKTLLKVHSQTEHADRCSFDTRFYISSAPLDIERIGSAARGHWGVESMHWLLDVAFKDDLSRYRAGHGAKNMAVVRRFALNLVRANKTRGSIKTRRKCAGWSPEFLLQVLQRGGHFVLNNQMLGANQENYISAAQLSQTTYQSGSGADMLWVRVTDGAQWSAWSQSFTVTAPTDTGSMVTLVSNINTTAGQTFAASSLFTDSDPFGDAIEQYDFWDTGSGGGHFMLNGQASGTNQDNYVSAGQLGQATYVAGRVWRSS